MSSQQYIPGTNFLVKELYDYLEGFGNYHKSEAAVGAIPKVNNSPLHPPLDLRTEKLSGSAFAGPRSLAVHTWVYRVQPSVVHGRHTPYLHELESGNPTKAKHLTPDSKIWNAFPLQESSDWFSQRLIGTTGNPAEKNGLSTWVYNIGQDMKPSTAFASLDGEALIVPQTGALDITTELGKLLVRANEIVVIPRGLRYHVKLVDGAPSRGYICELYQGHFRLPELGLMGTSGAAHVRDFQVPVAHFDGKIIEKDGTQVATSSKTNWTIVSRLDYKLYACEQDHTPFDVVGWHGTLYPYKYDLAKFDFLANVHYDHKDPSAHTVLTAPSYGKAPNTAVVDFIIFGKRHEAAMDTHRLPWYHRNTMNEFSYSIWAGPPSTDGTEIVPFPGAFSAGAVTAHGPGEEEYRALQEVDGMKPELAMDVPLTIAMFETECPLYLTEWAMETATENLPPNMKKIAD
ncbi:hypothetical protein PENARI_c006G00955 [Penicillium arizonense]|uniref:homogentisate 1,2-dioxygenase n=1 Tax=Penicillium arizonense TaxID=1835702 RepID=A0A1F5LM86_PENAI|nr:hypothetical protein PENARI_c006G00955 [Penicillium arizonense]OGE54041.1 hypothetical protein PENARI_c006G00955 [Penicillium arizonense]